MIAFILFLSGNYFDYRILSEMCGQNLISSEQKSFFAVITVVLKLVIVPWCQNSFLFLWILLLFPTLCLKIFSHFTKISRERGFESDFLSFLSLLLLIMKSGKGFAPSFIQAVHDGNFKNQHRLIEIYNFLIYSHKQEKKSVSPILSYILTDLNRAAKSSHNASKLISSLRDRLLAQKTLRERTNVVTKQARVQAIVLSLLFAGISVFTALNFGFKENVQFFILSISLFIIGIFWLSQIGKNHKWQV